MCDPNSTQRPLQKQAVICAEKKTVLRPTSGTGQHCLQKHAAQSRLQHPRPEAPHGVPVGVFKGLGKHRLRISSGTDGTVLLSHQRAHQNKSS